MQGYTRRKFSASLPDGHCVEHDIYTRSTGKDAAPVVVIVQELPGIGQETLQLADQFVAEGFTVVMPHLFGPLGKTDLAGNLVRVMCMRKEFRMFRQGGTSPVVNWLRSLCNDVKQRHQVRGVAVIGMCLTGNFAISLMADEAVLAGVASQPSLPIFRPRGIHMSDSDVEQIKQRLDQVGPMLAYRFAGDSLCQAEKFDQMNTVFNGDRERIRLRTLPGKGHAVLTLDFVDEAGHPTRQAFDEVLAYFRAALANT